MIFLNLTLKFVETFQRLYTMFHNIVDNINYCDGITKSTLDA